MTAVAVVFLRPLCEETVPLHGGLVNLEKSGSLALVREKSVKLWFACDVLLQLQWSQNTHKLRVVLSKVDMYEMDCKQCHNIHSGVHVGLSVYL